MTMMNNGPAKVIADSEEIEGGRGSRMQSGTEFLRRRHYLIFSRGIRRNFSRAPPFGEGTTHIQCFSKPSESCQRVWNLWTGRVHRDVLFRPHNQLLRIRSQTEKMMEACGVTNTDKSQERISMQTTWYSSSGIRGCQAEQVRVCTGGQVRSDLIISLSNLKDLWDADV